MTALAKSIVTLLVASMISTSYSKLKISRTVWGGGPDQRFRHDRTPKDDAPREILSPLSNLSESENALDPIFRRRNVQK